MHQFIFLPAVPKSSLSPHPSQHLLFLVFLIIAILTSKVIPHRFDFHFPYSLWCWASFHVPVGHLYCLLWKKNVYPDLLPIFKLDYLGFAIELYEFFTYFGEQPLIRYMINSYFPSFSRLLFPLLMISFAVQKLFGLM